jgi:hypothetical protein
MCNIYLDTVLVRLMCWYYIFLSNYNLSADGDISLENVEGFIQPYVELTILLYAFAGVRK